MFKEELHKTPHRNHNKIIFPNQLEFYILPSGRYNEENRSYEFPTCFEFGLNESFCTPILMELTTFSSDDFRKQHIYSPDNLLAFLSEVFTIIINETDVHHNVNAKCHLKQQGC